MSRNPSLHHAPLGYGKNGPLTWVAECRVPWEPPGPARLAIAQWMIDNGSDVHQGGDGPLMRAALNGYRIPMMELLVANGADVNAWWGGHFPIIFAPCESIDAQALRWLLAHGADPMCGGPRRRHLTALDYVIGTYARSAQLGECIEMLQAAGCTTRRGEPAVLAVLSGRIDRLVQLLESDPGLARRRFPDLDFGTTANRRLTLRGGTLLHVAAEYGNVAAARLLLEFGANVNARVEADAAGLGGQTPIFHAVSQYRGLGTAGGAASGRMRRRSARAGAPAGPLRPARRSGRVYAAGLRAKVSGDRKPDASSSCAARERWSNGLSRAPRKAAGASMGRPWYTCAGKRFPAAAHTGNPIALCAARDNNHRRSSWRLSFAA